MKLGCIIMLNWDGSREVCLLRCWFFSLVDLKVVKTIACVLFQ